MNDKNTYLSIIFRNFIRYKLIIQFLIASLLFGFTLYHIGIAEIRHSFELLLKVDFLSIIFASIIVVVFGVGAGALRQWILLKPTGPTNFSFLWLLALHCSCSAAYCFMPGPFPEAYKISNLYSQYRFKVSSVLAAQVTERILEALGLTLVALSIFCIGEKTELDLVYKIIYWFGIIGFIGIITIFIIANRAKKIDKMKANYSEGLFLRFQSFILNLAIGLRTLRTSIIWSKVLFISLIAEISNIASIALCLYALGNTTDYHTWILLALIIRATALIPILPGQLGVLETSIVILLSAVGISYSESLSFAVIYRFVHSIPVFIVGIVGLLYMLHVRKSKTEYFV